MVYVERNDRGEIISLRREADKPGMELKTIMDNEILDFLGRTATDEMKLQILSMSDVTVARILEDLIELLISKNVIMFTELPEMAQQKILARKQIRQQIGGKSIIVEDIL